MYLTYEEYIKYGGALDETTFTDYCWEAKTIIDWYTFNRIDRWFEEEIPEAIKRCAYKLIQLAELKAKILLSGMPLNNAGVDENNLSIASQSNDGVSISYNVMSAIDIFKTLNPFEEDSAITQTIKTYLSGVTDSRGRNLLYRGMYSDE